MEQIIRLFTYYNVIPIIADLLLLILFIHPFWPRLTGLTELVGEAWAELNYHTDSLEF